MKKKKEPQVTEKVLDFRIYNRLMKDRAVNDQFRKAVQMAWAEAVKKGDFESQALMVRILVDRRLAKKVKSKLIDNRVSEGEWADFGKYFLDWLKDGGAETILKIVLQIIAALA